MKEKAWLRRPLVVLVLAAGLLAGMAACTTTGNRFKGSGLAQLSPGVSTYPEVVAELGALPSATYQQRDGSFIAHWYERRSLLTDGFYGSKEAVLAFGADGRFLRLLDSRNVRLGAKERTRLLGVQRDGADRCADSLIIETNSRACA